MGTQFIVYISSTLDDLADERAAALATIAEVGQVKHTYRADEKSPVAACVGDVRACHLYVGILGMRYGWVPGAADGGDGSKSITELEYESCVDAAGQAIPRLMFLKQTDAGIPAKFIDALSQSEPTGGAAVKAFRDRASREQTPFLFKNIHEFRAEVRVQVTAKANAFHAAQAAAHKPILTGRPGRRNELAPVAVACVPGTDSTQHDALRQHGGGNVVPFDLSPDEPAYLAELDSIAARHQMTALLVTPASLGRFAQGDRAAMVAAALEMLRTRTGHAPLLCEGVDPAALPAGWQAATIVPIAAGALAGTGATQAVEALYRDLRAVNGQLTHEPRFGLPYMVIAPTLAEIEALTGPDPATTFAAFGPLLAHRRAEFDRIAAASRGADPQWPTSVYGARRQDWKCFGTGTASAESIVRGSIDRINGAREGSREKRVLQGAKLLPRRYDLEEHLVDRWGSRRIIEGLQATSLLVLVDEFALFHPRLREIARIVLSGARNALVSITPCDPGHTRIDTLLDENSYLSVGNLVSRFKNDLDPRCEIAVNSINRIERWLSATLPEMVAAAGDQHSDPDLLRRMEQELAR